MVKSILKFCNKSRQCLICCKVCLEIIIHVKSSRMSQIDQVEKSLRNFRVKIDLSSIYDNERKLSYMYVDEVKMTNVLHLHTKIQNIFGITHSFYLTVNDIYLPVNEDIRIVKQDDIIVVKSFSAVPKDIESRNHEEVIHEHQPNKWQRSYDDLSKQDSITDDLPKQDSITDDKTNDSQIHEPDRMQNKRKRIRRRQKKFKNEELDYSQKILQHNSISPQKLSLEVNGELNSNKHIKFSWDDSGGYEKDSNQNASIDDSITSPKSVDDMTAMADLDLLLNLKNNGLPLTFSGRKRTEDSFDLLSVLMQSPKVTTP